MKKSWILNAIVAVIAAIFAILQEKWLGTPLLFLNLFCLGASCALALSVCVEIARKVFSEIGWNWSRIIIGAGYGIIAALILSAILCG